MTSTAPPLSTNTGYIQVTSLTSTDVYYAFLDLAETSYDGRPIQLSPSISDAQVFYIDSSGYIRSGSFAGEQDPYDNDSNDPSNNCFFMAPADEVASYGSGITQPTCSVSATLQLSCTEAPQDGRNVISICPSTADEFGTIYSDTPYLVLDTQIDSGCDVAYLTIIPQP